MLPDPVVATIAEAERLGFVVASVEAGPFEALDVETEEGVPVERVTVVFERGPEAVPMSWVNLDGTWTYAAEPRATPVKSHRPDFLR